MTTGLLLAGLRAVAPAVGMLFSLGLAAVIAQRSRVPGALTLMVTYTFAFALLSLPAWLVLDILILGPGD